MNCWCGTPLTERQLRRGNKSCSRKHGSIFQRQRAMPIETRRAWIAKANAARREQHATRVVRVILDDFKPLVNAEGLVVLREAVMIVLKHRALGYQRGWSAHDARRMRAIAS